jgi:hypothetical protein
MCNNVDKKSGNHNWDSMYTNQEIVFLGKCPSGQMSLGQIYLSAIAFLGKCPSGQMSSGQMSFVAKVSLGKRPSGQTSFFQTS